jgi:hypothetical protein
MKKTTRNILHITITAIISLLITVSCQKVIHVDLNTANATVVIDGYVTDQPGIDTVKITMSGSYFTPGIYPRVTNARVIVSDNTGLTDTLVQVDSGIYTTTHLVGVPGRTYTMKAFVNGKEYDAVSTMPAATNIDSVIAVETVNISNAGVVDSYYRVRCFFPDPNNGQVNYYRLQLTLADTLLDSLDNLTLTNDKFSAGRQFNTRLRGPYKAHLGETAKVDLMSIDAGTYNYYSVVRSIASAGNPVSTAVPQNPPTNIIGGALGYFSAYAQRSQTIVIP